MPDRYPRRAEIARLADTLSIPYHRAKRILWPDGPTKPELVEELEEVSGLFAAETERAESAEDDLEAVESTRDSLLDTVETLSNRLFERTEIPWQHAGEIKRLRARCPSSCGCSEPCRLADLALECTQ